MKKSKLWMRQELIRKIEESVLSNFPFFYTKQADRFRNIARRLSLRMKHTVSEREFFFSLERLLAGLGDAHTKLGDYPTKRWFGPKDHIVRCVDRIPYLFRGRKNLGKILSIDDQSFSAVLRFHEQRISSGSKSFRIHQASKFTLLSQTSEPCVVKLALGGSYNEVRLRRTRRKNAQPASNQFVRMGGIGIFRIYRWENSPTMLTYYDRVTKRLKSKKYIGLIIDLRENRGGSGNGAAWFAGHFFRRTTNFGFAKERTLNSSHNLTKRQLLVRARTPFLHIPIVILTSVETISANEYFLAGMHDNKRAILIGERTGGSSGNPKKHTIPYDDSGIEIWVSTWRYFRPNGKKLEGVGIRPDIIIKPTLKDIENGRDPALERAIGILRERRNLDFPPKRN